MLFFSHPVFFVKVQLVFAWILGLVAEFVNTLVIIVINFFELVTSLGFVNAFFVFVKDSFCFLELS